MTSEASSPDEREESVVYGNQHSRTGETQGSRNKGDSTQENAHGTAITASFTVSSGEFELGRKLAAASVTRIELDPTRSLGEPVPSQFRVKGDGDALETALHEAGCVDRFDKIDGAESRFGVQWAADVDGFISHILESDMTVQDVTGTAEQWQFDCRFESGDELAGFHEACCDDDIVVEVNRLYHSTQSSSQTAPAGR